LLIITMTSTIDQTRTAPDKTLVLVRPLNYFCILCAVIHNKCLFLISFAASAPPR
jgi:hypothetical protein